MVDFSPYQKEIFTFVKDGEGNGSVGAFAGSGKTTTGVEAIRSFPKHERGYFMSFGRKIADELGERLWDVDNVESSTYNSFGWRIVKNHLNKFIKLNKFKTWNILKPLVHDKKYYQWRGSMSRLISLAKSMCYLTSTELIENVHDMAAKYDVNLPEDEEYLQVLAAVFDKCAATTNIMDFDDQKWMVFKLGIPIPQVDFLLVDEYQDTCEVETRLVLGACREGRKIAIGDPNQAIYSFKGTTPDSMKLFDERFNAHKMSLPICYRCSKEVVREAQKIVPGIQYFDNAIEGSVEDITRADFEEKVEPGDFVLCRVTLGLVKSVMSFIRRDKPAYIVGAEIGDQLINFVDTIAGGVSDIVSFSDKLEDYYIRQMEILDNMNRENEKVQLEDKYETIRVLIPDSSDVYRLKERIKDLFKDKDNAIKHLTIHKAKGLECRDTYLLEPEKLPHPRGDRDEEMRLKYVAITRAGRTFHYVRENPR